MFVFGVFWGVGVLNDLTGKSLLDSTFDLHLLRALPIESQFARFLAYTHFAMG
jgi:hypothetical protein